MPPAQPLTLAELVEQLGRTYSPFERLKIVGRAWGLLRRMGPEERLTVASQLGLDNADEIVEAIAARAGKEPPHALLAMIESAQVKGPAHLPGLVADLRDPAKRGARLKQGVQAVEKALTQGPPPLPGAAARPAQAPQVPPVQARPAPPPPPAAEPAPAPPPPPAAAPPVAAEARTPAPQPPAPPPTPPPTLPRPAPSPKAAPAPAPPPEPARPSGEDRLAVRLAAAPSLTTRFRVLRRHLNDARGASVEGLQALLEGFPDGWPRRRALLELLRAGTPGSLRDALLLVETLAAERDRLWCLGALADSRRPAAADRETLLGAVASPAARRRLERRLDR